MHIEQAAGNLGLAFLGIWLEGSADMLRHRVEQRRGGPSDATVDILSLQLRRDAGEIAWHRLDASRSPAATVSDILALLAA